MIRIAVVGARRRRQGLGEFLARILHEAGAEVCAVVGSTLERAEETRRYLRDKYGFDAPAYGDLPALFAADRGVDAVAICSPHALHRPHLEKAAAGGAHVLCEKPLLWDDRHLPDAGPRLDLVSETRRILALFRGARRRLFLNTQWPYVLEAFWKLYPATNPDRIEDFEMGMCPPAPGLAMIPEAAPHAISLVLALCGRGRIEDLSAAYADAERSHLTISFRYKHPRGTTACRLVYAATDAYPRPSHIAINGHRMDRVVRMPAYEIGFAGDRATVWPGDPLRRLVEDFLKAIGDGPAPNRRGADADILFHAETLTRLSDAVEALGSAL